MKKFLLLSYLIACLFSSESIAMGVENDTDERERIDIRAITPIKSDMDSQKRREVVRDFLTKALDPVYELNQADIVSTQTRQIAGGRSFQTYTLKDGSEWVMGSGGLNRFLGHLYLKRAIEHYGLQTLCVVETRFAYKDPGNRAISITISPRGQDRLKNIPVINSTSFFSLSRYIGDTRVEALGEVEAQELERLRKEIGFVDIDGNTNLRRHEGKIYIIDTEYGSFAAPYAPYFVDDGDLKFTLELK